MVAMLSYVYFGTNDLDKSVVFYSATLAPLGMEPVSYTHLDVYKRQGL